MGFRVSFWEFLAEARRLKVTGLYNKHDRFNYLLGFRRGYWSHELNTLRR
ncbi:hypothetical protein ES703_121016 [subsurface metagenome]